ncbi:MAG TPA: VCBS repeat-containing protein [Candidatus Thermoplasmatota archaeon]|jgi:hypothetical protein|nr:VCBS repeat-containing protein [Candidatus Thermoplasmatota archaeon]
MQRWPRWAPLAAAILLAVPALASSPTLTLTITEADAQPTHAWQPFDAYPVKLYDIDGDGRKEIIDHNDNKYVYILDSATGELLTELTTTFPAGWEARTINGVEVQVMQPGAPPSLIVGNSAAYITRFDYNASASTATNFVFDEKWERRLNDYTANPGMDAKPVLHDVDYTHVYEIYAQVEEQGVFALRANGTVIWKHNASGGNAEPVIADVDLDGHLEALFFSDSGLVRVYTAKTGAAEWTFDATSYISAPASIPRGGTVAQLDGSGRREVVFCARDAHDANNWDNDHMALFVLQNDDNDAWGNLKWMRQPSWANPLCYTRPVVWDDDGDGKADIYGMDWNTEGHFPGNWSRLGPAHVFSFDRSGNERWNTTLDTWWSNKDIALADLDGDGSAEVLASGPNDAGHDGWWLLNPATGAQEQFIDVDPYKSTRAPRVGDLDGDGDLEFVAPVEGEAGNTNPGEGAFQVWDAGPDSHLLLWSGGEDKYAGVWPFKASFAPHADSNQYYVKVKVTSFHKVVKAWYSVDDGGWLTLNHLATGASWTYWDQNQNVNIPDGSDVRFKAEDDKGKQLTSGLFTWPV